MIFTIGRGSKIGILIIFKLIYNKFYKTHTNTFNVCKIKLYSKWSLGHHNLNYEIIYLNFHAYLLFHVLLKKKKTLNGPCLILVGSLYLSPEKWPNVNGALAICSCLKVLPAKR